ncbi:hypothetical protein ACFJIW_01700 [Tahibacter sp. UC22_41]|uniref:hypothetical protein n=1 Tax=Tahibacter sp. UC22_41 TaxID=3350178 RepID=UPI0036D87123
MGNDCGYLRTTQQPDFNTFKRGSGGNGVIDHLGDAADVAGERAGVDLAQSCSRAATADEAPR